MVDPSVGATMEGEAHLRMCEGSRGRRGRSGSLKDIGPNRAATKRDASRRPPGAQRRYSSNFTLLVVLPATWACHNISVKSREKINASEVSARRVRRNRNRIQSHRRVYRPGHHYRRRNDRPKAHRTVRESHTCIDPALTRQVASKAPQG